MPGPVALVGAADHTKDNVGGEPIKLGQPPSGVALPSSVSNELCGVCGSGFPDRLQLWVHIHHCDYIG
ncbi:hypothetical protein GGI18_005367, partial [Coemansia linderi]